MTRTSLYDAPWASLMLTMRQIPRTREIPQRLSLGSVVKRRCGGLSRPRCGSVGRVRRGATWPMTLVAGPVFTTASGAGQCAAGGAWCPETLRPVLPVDGLVLLDGTTCKAHRAASGAARSNAEAGCLGRSRGRLCSKLHVRANGAGRILRLMPSPGQQSDLRYAPALVSPRRSHCDFAGIPACDAALDRGYVSARLHAAFAADGCAVHTPPKLGMVDPPPWDKTIYTRRHHVENLFSKL